MNRVRNETPKSIGDWAVETFGNPTPERAFARMAEEWEELRKEVESGYANISMVIEEMADVHIVMCQLARAMNESLQIAIDRKMAKNRARKWNVGKDGTGYHVKE